MIWRKKDAKKRPSGLKEVLFQNRVFVSVCRATDLLERRESLWKSFLATLLAQNDFVPVAFDPEEEPPRYVFDPSDVSGPMQLLMRRSESINTGTIMSAGPINWEGLSAEEAFFRRQENITAFLQLSQQLYGVFKPHYGRICHQGERNSQNTIYTYFPKGHAMEGKVYSEKGFGGNTRQGIPGVYWANFFGRIYVDTIGRGKFLTAPCYRREELPDGGFLLITSESPLDWDKPDVQELRKAMRDHLGYEYFCDIKNPDRRCKVPSFDFSVWEKELERARNAKRRLKD